MPPMFEKDMLPVLVVVAIFMLLAYDIATNKALGPIAQSSSRTTFGATCATHFGSDSFALFGGPK